MADIRAPNARIAARRDRVRKMHDDRATVREIATAVCVTPATVYSDLRALGRHEKYTRHGDTVATQRANVARRKAEALKDRRRFKTVPIPMGAPARTASAEATGTVFPTRVFDPTPGENVLVDGNSNSKIGGDVLVGWLQGARIVTLTLEERATCPSSCEHWRTCYGNSMQHPRRWRHGPALEAKIEQEAQALCRQHRRVLVRLHVLGDFYSVSYVQFWLRLLQDLPGLHLFGFTAWPVTTPIGALIAAAREEIPARFAIRTSGMTGPWGSFTLDFPTAKRRIGDAVVCPEQRDAMENCQSRMHCGACGLCWKGDTPIAFVEH